MNDNQDPVLTARRRRGRLVAGPALGLLAGLLTFQMTAVLPPALGAALAAGLLVFAAWGPLVVREEGASYGRAVGLGFAATFAAFFGAAVFGIGTGAASGREAAGVAVFALAMVLPVMVAAAIGLAALTGRRDAG